MRTAFVVSLLLLVACRRTPAADDAAAAADAAPDASPTSTAPSDASCRTYASATCAAFTRCEASQVSMKYGTAKECEDRIFAECKYPSELPGESVSDKSLLACAAYLKDTSCPVGREDGDCAEPKGTFEIGAACVYGSQCQSMNCDHFAKGAKDGCGICAAAREERPRRPAQQSGFPCDEGFSCGWHLACVDKKCVPESKAGEKCNAKAESCEAGTTCKNGKCAAVSVQKLGDTCTTDFLGEPTGAAPCGPGLRCQQGTGKNPNKCVRVATEGESCGKAGPLCAFPFTCVLDKCVTPLSRYRACAAR